MKSDLVRCSFFGIFFLVSLTGMRFGGGSQPSNSITLFLCGDVMLGRGIDQALPFPCEPEIHESYMKNAIGYLRLAEKANGSISHPVSYSYVWGDALDELERLAPDLRIINLETGITTSNDYMESKGIHYRMNPKNVPCLTAAGIDFCSLANNHVLDWGHAGLKETLVTLKSVGIQYAGAGLNRDEAEALSILDVEGRGRVIVYSCGMSSSGIPAGWAALPGMPGVNLLFNFSDSTVLRIRDRIRAVKRSGDIAVVSIHWGGNWGYKIPSAHVKFAHQLIDEAGVDVIHGHSSHHVLGIEVYKNRPILYGCGDFLNDYEGIGGYEYYRDDLSLMYFVNLDPATGKLHDLKMVPTKIRCFKVNRASRADALWLKNVLNREGKRFGTRVEMEKGNNFVLQWN